MNVLVAGGAGYIGSHTMVELLNFGHNVICVDNLYNSSIIAIKRVESITSKKIKFYNCDLIYLNQINKIFDENKIDVVMMFAGYKAVGESNEKPLEYYYNNLLSSMNMIEVMRKHNCKNFIFSSSATVYGSSIKVPIDEDSYVGDLNLVTNPYGRSKLIIEQILKDVGNADKNFKIVILRYFNPVGAHDSGLIGEDPKGIPNNLMPFIAQVAVKKRDILHIFGNDYKTKDGTGVRDYIHVVDLSIGHVFALDIFNADNNKFTSYGKNKNVYIYNLGTGIGYSVLDVKNAYEKASGIEIPFVFDNRRSGDVDELYCLPDRALKELNWRAKRDLNDMCKSSYNFQKNNPNGYNDEISTEMIFSK